MGRPKGSKNKKGTKTQSKEKLNPRCVKCQEECKQPAFVEIICCYVDPLFKR